jgi:hypothetical protein
MSYAVRCRPVTAETWVRPRVSPCEIWGQDCTGIGWTVNAWVFRCVIRPMLHTHLHLELLSPEGQAAEYRDLPKSSAVSEIGELWVPTFGAALRDTNVQSYKTTRLRCSCKIKNRLFPVNMFRPSIRLSSGRRLEDVLLKEWIMSDRRRSLYTRCCILWRVHLKSAKG